MCYAEQLYSATMIRGEQHRSVLLIDSEDAKNDKIVLRLMNEIVDYYDCRRIENDKNRMCKL